MLVLGGGVFIADGFTGRFFPILEMVPLVGKTTWAGVFPRGVETIRGVESDGELWVGEVGMGG